MRLVLREYISFPTPTTEEDHVFLVNPNWSKDHLSRIVLSKARIVYENITLDGTACLIEINDLKAWTSASDLK